MIARVKERQRRFTMGTYPVLTLGDARNKARQVLRDVQMGVYDDDSPAPGTTMLGEAVVLFVSFYAKPKNKGWRETERILSKFECLYDRPLNQLRRAKSCACWTCLLPEARRIVRTAPSLRSRNCLTGHLTEA